MERSRLEFQSLLYWIYYSYKKYLKEVMNNMLVSILIILDLLFLFRVRSGADDHALRVSILIILDILFLYLCHRIQR